jgi:hypothetical protein
VVVETVARASGIPSAKYKLSSGILITSGGRKSQGAKLSLKQVEIARFARFLSSIQARWANLQVTRLKLTRKKESPDSWDADVDLKYYY